MNTRTLAVMLLALAAASCVSLPHGTANERILIRNVLAEGTVPMEIKTSDQVSKELPPPVEVRLKKVWSQGNDQPDLNEFLKSRFGDNQIVTVQIANTTCSIILVNGRPQPLILEVEAWRLWELQGVTERFTESSDIANWRGGIALTHRSGDIREIWALDLSEGSIRVRYWTEIDWY